MRLIFWSVVILAIIVLHIDHALHDYATTTCATIYQPNPMIYSCLSGL